MLILERILWLELLHIELMRAGIVFVRDLALSVRQPAYVVSGPTPTS